MDPRNSRLSILTAEGAWIRGISARITGSAISIRLFPVGTAGAYTPVFTSEMQRPRARAALRHLTFDETGRMWVEIAASGGFAWEIFSSDGRLLGSAPAPARTTAVPPYVRGNRLYLVEEDSVGIQYVAVYAIGPA